MIRHLYWVAGAAVVLSVPLVPDDAKISISLDPVVTRKSEKPYDVIVSSCSLRGESINAQGLQVCEYHCAAGDKQTIYKTSRANVICQNSIQEQLKQTKR